MRIWLAIGLLVLSIAAARAIPSAQQIIIFGGNSSASNPPLVTVGSALLVDNTNPALLVDNTNPACLAGGC